MIQSSKNINFDRLSNINTQEALILLAAGKTIYKIEHTTVEMLEVSIHKGSFWVNQDDGLDEIMYLNDYTLMVNKRDHKQIIEPIQAALSDLHD